ncbi:MAG: class I SAM-dependent methyltransferase [Methanoregulaceae archaeon]|nr:class I SAM-dependent methyltransferase [Methanoregulaceae archaeon]
MPDYVFERYAEEYDRWFEEHREEYLAEMARIRRLLPPIDSTAMEVGAGSGRFTASLGIAIGIEPSRALGRMARRRGIEIIRGRAEFLPTRDGSCSCVLLVTVICYLEDPVPVFREIHRSLIPAGFLIIAFIEREGQIHRRYLREGGKGRFLSQAKFYSLGEVLAALRETGFYAVRVDSRDGFCVIAAQKNHPKTFPDISSSLNPVTGER